MLPFPIIGLVMLALVVALSGCAELGGRGITYSLEGIDAAKAYVDEKTDRREALRKKLYELEDQYLACLSAGAMVQVESGMDCTRSEQAVRKAASYIDEIYPDLAKVVDEIDKLKAAIKRLEAS